MSIKNSYLSQSNYDYDTVVAITQNALNDAIKSFYVNEKKRSKFIPLTIYYVWMPIGGGKYAPCNIDTAGLLRQTNGVDPLTVPSWNGTGLMPSQVSDVVNSTANFAFAFTITPGDPSGLGMPGIKYIELTPGEQAARYYLLCENVQFAFWNPDNKTWANVMQTTAREFNISATIGLQNIVSSDNLPDAVQSRVNELGPTNVNVQQLIFDFDSAVVDPTSTLPQLDSSCSIFTAMMKEFGICYFAAYENHASPVLNYGIIEKNPSTLQPTAMSCFAGALTDANGSVISSPDLCQQNLATLNCLFAVNGNTLPAGKQFTWNWLEDNGVNPSPATDPNADINNYDGAIAIKRDALAQYFDDQLSNYVKGNCYVAEIGSEESLFNVTFSESTPIGGVQSRMPEFPDRLVLYNFNSIVKQQGLAGDYMKIQNRFDFAILIMDTNTLMLTQSLLFRVDASIAGEYYDGVPLAKQIDDFFEIIVGDDGAITFKRDETRSTVADQSEPIIIPNGEFITQLINQLVLSSFEEVPAELPKQFVFPGGNAFSFSDAQFSQYSDLVCHVKYQSEQ